MMEVYSKHLQMMRQSWERCCSPGIPKFGRWKHKDQEFKGILGHRTNLKTA